MRTAVRIVALHGALWSIDRWYRWSWFVWPGAIALLISGWICIDKPDTVPSSGAASGNATIPKSAIQTATTTLKTTPPPPRPGQLEYISCFASNAAGSEAACAKAIDLGVFKGPQLASLYTQRGYLQREKDPDRALVDYEAALKVQSDFVDALAGRAWIAMTRGRYDDALQDLDKALDRSPSAGTARYYRGYAYLKLKNYPQALTDLNEAIRLQPNNADYYLARGEVQHALESYEAALSDFDAFSKRAPKDARGLIWRSEVLDAMGKPQDALAALEIAVSLSPGDSFAVSERDRLRAQQNAADRQKGRDNPPQ